MARGCLLCFILITENGINNGKKTPEVSKNQFSEAQLALGLKGMPLLKDKRLRQGPVDAIQRVGFTFHSHHPLVPAGMPSLDQSVNRSTEWPPFRM